jgi:hypothetical protein
MITPAPNLSAAVLLSKKISPAVYQLALVCCGHAVLRCCRLITGAAVLQLTKKVKVKKTKTVLRFRTGAVIEA